MVAIVRDFYVEQPAYLPLTGGAGFDFRLTVYRIQRTTVDGKTTEFQRLGPFNFAGWTDFVAELTPHGTTGVAFNASFSLEPSSSPSEGLLRLKGTHGMTWTMQQAGYRAGDCTLLGHNPAGERMLIYPCVWDLTVGSTSPTAFPTSTP